MTAEWWVVITILIVLAPISAWLTTQKEGRRR